MLLLFRLPPTLHSARSVRCWVIFRARLRDAAFPKQLYEGLHVRIEVHNDLQPREIETIRGIVGRCVCVVYI